MEDKKYCPFCDSNKPLVKAGKAMRKDTDRQRWQCVNKSCRRFTVNPLLEPKK